MPGQNILNNSVPNLDFARCHVLARHYVISALNVKGQSAPFRMVVQNSVLFFRFCTFCIFIIFVLFCVYGFSSYSWIDCHDGYSGCHDGYSGFTDGYPGCHDGYYFFVLIQSFSETRNIPAPPSVEVRN